MIARRQGAWQPSLSQRFLRPARDLPSLSREALSSLSQLSHVVILRVPPVANSSL